MLLAREWPHLRALMDGGVPGLDPGQARRLVRRTLKIVQGHPELIKLADGYAATPDRLAKRLKDATRTWQGQAVRLDPFLRGEEPDITGEDYLAVLHDWTRAAVAALPPEASTFFQFLCCLEEADRTAEVVDSCWARLWQELGRRGNPPDPQRVLAVLAGHALASLDIDRATGKPVRFRVHPAVAEAGRVGAGPDFADAVGTEVAGAWLGTWAHAIVGERREGLGGLVREAALHAVPYLLRQQRWDALYFTCEQVLHRDDSPAAAAALLPILSLVAQATRGTNLELGANLQHARALAILDPDQGETRFRQILDTALARDDFGIASAVSADLSNLYRRSGRHEEADRLVKAKISYTTQARLGPWAELSDRTDLLHTPLEQGDYQLVLDTVEALRGTMASLPDPADENVSVHWNVRERILSLGVAASSHLERWQYALDLSAEIRESLQSRGASATEQAAAAFNTYWALLRLGRPDDARRLLHQCRTVFEAHNDIDMLGSTFGALARVEEDQGRLDRALSLEADAIRFSYLARDPDAIQIRHRYYADILLRQAADPMEIWGHRIAAAMISYQTGGLHPGAIDVLSALLGEGGAPEDARSFAEVCAITDQVAGVHLAQLIGRLSARAPDGQCVMDEVLRLASHQLDEQIQRHLDEWEPVMNYLACAQDPDAAIAQPGARELDRILRIRGEQPGWKALVAVLRRIGGGELNADLYKDLDPIDTAIVQFTFDAQAAYRRARAGDPEGAEEAYRPLLDTRLRVLGSNHPLTLKARSHQANLRGIAGDVAGAVGELKKVLADGIEALGHEHDQTQEIREVLNAWRQGLRQPLVGSTIPGAFRSRPGKTRSKSSDS